MSGTQGKGSVTVTRTKKQRGKVVDENTGRTDERVDHPEAKETAKLSPKALARVGVGRGATVNMGGMEFHRIDVSLELPCRPSVDAIETTYGFADDWTDRKLEEQIEIAVKQRG